MTYQPRATNRVDFELTDRGFELLFPVRLTSQSTRVTRDSDGAVTTSALSIRLPPSLLTAARTIFMLRTVQGMEVDGEKVRVNVSNGTTLSARQQCAALFCDKVDGFELQIPSAGSATPEELMG